VASKCAKADTFIPPSTEEQYKVVHGRILAKCRDLANESLFPEPRRHLAVQLDELLRPWTSAKSLKEAPPGIVHDLVKNQTILDERLRGKTTRPALGKLRTLIVTACFSAMAGLLMVLFLQWTDNAASPSRGLWSSIETYLGRTTFTEQFAIALLVCWLFGTWLLSRLSRS
jgi:hypothetical protein